MSDRLFQVGPLKIGLDGILTWIPGIGDAYGIGASAYLLSQAARAGASQECITRMAVLLGVDAVAGALPVAGDLFDVVFRAHARAADVLKDEIDRIHAEAVALPAPAAATRRPPAARRFRPDIDLRDYAPPEPPPTPAPPLQPQPPARPEPSMDEQSEWEQARRVEALRAQYRERGGGIDGRRR